MASYLVGSLTTNRLLRVVTMARLVLAGALMVLVAAILLCLGVTMLGIGVIEIIAPMCLWMLGFAFIMPGVTTAALALFPRNAGSASALMGSLQMGMGFVGAALCSVFADAATALAVVPPAMGALAVLAYLGANWRSLAMPTGRSPAAKTVAPTRLTPFNRIVDLSLRVISVSRPPLTRSAEPTVGDGRSPALGISAS